MKSGITYRGLVKLARGWYNMDGSWNQGGGGYQYYGGMSGGVGHTLGPGDTRAFRYTDGLRGRHRSSVGRRWRAQGAMWDDLKRQGFPWNGRGAHVGSLNEAEALAPGWRQDYYGSALYPDGRRRPSARWSQYGYHRQPGWTGQGGGPASRGGVRNGQPQTDADFMRGLRTPRKTMQWRMEHDWRSRRAGQLAKGDVSVFDDRLGQSRPMTAGELAAARQANGEWLDRYGNGMPALAAPASGSAVDYWNRLRPQPRGRRPAPSRAPAPQDDEDAYNRGLYESYGY